MTRFSLFSCLFLLLLGSLIGLLPGCPSDGSGDDDDSSATTAPATATPTPTATPTREPGTYLPVPITDIFFLSGYFSDWGTGDTWTTLRESETPGACPQRAGDERGECLAVTYNRNPDDDGMGPTYSGYFWQYPEGNWATPGFRMPSGATQVSFWAWGESGGEQIKFITGLSFVDSFEETTGVVTLTNTPTEYVIDISGVTYNQVAGAFAWRIDDNLAPLNNSAWTFFVDDITWE